MKNKNNLPKIYMPKIQYTSRLYNHVTLLIMVKEKKKYYPKIVVINKFHDCGLFQENKKVSKFK